ncbi:hypothetical protein GCM10029964_077590 [Kibdelosporangium lantanae]
MARLGRCLGLAITDVHPAAHASLPPPTQPSPAEARPEPEPPAQAGGETPSGPTVRSPGLQLPHVTEDAAPTVHVAALRERVYATLVGLSTVVLLLNYADSTSVGEAVAEIAAGMGALCLAGAFADVSAHRIAHEGFPRGKDLRHVAHVAAQVLETAFVPVVSVAVAGLGWWSLRTGLGVAALSLVVTIGVLAVLAIRHTSLRWPVRVVIVVVEMVIAVGVVGVKLLAH